MRHYKKGRKLGTDASHTKAMKISLVKALFTNDRIKTIEARAKEIRPDVDRIITWAKKGDLHSRRLAIAALGNDKDLVYEIFAKVDAGMFAGREGGYTRIMKLGNRKGDNAPIVIMELVREPVQKKADKKAEDKPAAKAAPKDRMLLSVRMLLIPPCHHLHHGVINLIERYLFLQRFVGFNDRMRQHDRKHAVFASRPRP